MTGSRGLSDIFPIPTLYFINCQKRLLYYADKSVIIMQINIRLWEVIMSIYNLGKNRMLCWDDFLIDKIDSAEIRMHKPVRREKVITMDKCWEGNVCGYPSIIKLKNIQEFTKSLFIKHLKFIL